MSETNSGMPHLDVELSAYVSDELEEFERKRVEEHLATCPQCMEQLQRLQKLDVLLTQEELEPSPDFLDSVLWRVDQEKKVLSFRFRKRIAVIVAAAILVFFVLLLSLKQTPIPPPVAVKTPVHKTPERPKSVTPTPAPRPAPVEDPELIAYLDELENMELIGQMESLDNLEFAIVLADTGETK